MGPVAGESARWRRWLAADRPWPIAVTGIVGLLLSFWSPWRAVELKGFDTLTVLTAPNEAPIPITLVAIDEESLAELGQWPWPRGVHAKLLERLKEAGVTIAAFDVVFAEPDRDPSQDAAFAAAIRAFGAPVVLAANIEVRDTAHARMLQRIDPLKRLVEAGAMPGLATVRVDPDGVIRNVPTSQGAFWLSIVTAFDKVNPGIARNLSVTEDDRIRYLGGPQTFTTIPYHRLLDPEKLLSPNWKDVLRDNIAIVGRALKVSPELNLVEADMFITPFTARTGLYTPGAEVQATLVANMMLGDTRREAPASYVVALVLLACAAAWLVMRPWHVWRSGALVVVLLAAIAGAMFALFHWQRLWLPGGAAMVTLVLAYSAEGTRSYLAEQARRQALRRAFASYVSPAVVDEIIANADTLRLGGDRREITLLFTDLAGFTGFAERLPAEQVAAILNRHLGEMTDVVIANGGTVDKFIGDAVMAMWGAPIADPDQSLHALEAAVAMQAATARMGAELASSGGPTVRMRVGLHRGECIVGNLGGHNRFEYTAIGDAVNLASRLEGVNNVYGTGILASDAVARTAGAGARLRPVDAVRVKGRQQAVELFTPCEDGTLVERTVEALDAYRGGRWNDAVAKWRGIADQWPQDPVARVFIARLAAWEASGWPDPWDGVTTLESK